MKCATKNWKIPCAAKKYKICSNFFNLSIYSMTLLLMTSNEILYLANIFFVLGDNALDSEMISTHSLFSGYVQCHRIYR